MRDAWTLTIQWGPRDRNSLEVSQAVDMTAVKVASPIHDERRGQRHVTLDPGAEIARRVLDGRIFCAHPLPVTGVPRGWRVA